MNNNESNLSHDTAEYMLEAINSLRKQITPLILEYKDVPSDCFSNLHDIIAFDPLVLDIFYKHDILEMQKEACRKIKESEGFTEKNNRTALCILEIFATLTLLYTNDFNQKQKVYRTHRDSSIKALGLNVDFGDTDES